MVVVCKDWRTCTNHTCRYYWPFNPEHELAIQHGGRWKDFEEKWRRRIQAGRFPHTTIHCDAMLYNAEHNLEEVTK